MSVRTPTIQHTSIDDVDVDVDVESDIPIDIQKKKRLQASRTKAVLLISTLGFFISLSGIFYVLNAYTTQVSTPSLESGRIPNHSSDTKSETIMVSKDLESIADFHWLEPNIESKKEQSTFGQPVKGLESNKENWKESNTGGDGGDSGEGEGGDDGDGDGDGGEDGDNNSDDDEEVDDSIGGRIRKAIRDFIEKILFIVTVPFKALWNAIVSTLEYIINLLKAPFTAIWGVIVSVFEIIVDIAKAPFAFIWGCIVSAFDFIKESTPCLLGYLYYMTFCGVVGAILVPTAVTVFALLAGFLPAGILAGSFAAYLMFTLGPITVAGGFVAMMQSIGVLGISSVFMPPITLGGFIGGATVGLVIGITENGGCPLVPIL